ncbi:MAG: hypothetical protein GY820_29810, partial [Gammaproteobacteria bacterium]|nr:hypothetical protein [Gammaproteobacteria bacterium]
MKVGAEVNPLFATHMDERIAFLCQKGRLQGGPEFRERYKEQWRNDETYGTETDLLMHIMNQAPRPVPAQGDYNALTTSNVFSSLFASHLGQGVNSEIIGRPNLLDGVDELKTSLNNSGSNRLSMYVQGYHGPWGSYPMPVGLKMPAEHEKRLRVLNFSAPGQLEGEHAIYLILVAMHGHPIVFRLADFVEEVNGQYSKYEMRFPTALKEVLDKCDLLVWGWEEQ